ncbi:DUF3168 domain-containing protein [Paenibacillus sp. Soil724D2]|uniref:DUF3168 domain-containing protein n=1 Tax=Paenibacillus sp. (strain Soil724D2) TaxID=1736392 RepID=UPI0007146D13|nr:DUF3168 domain-containing protein [Paenibacillus sp. Soil724D2]KRE33426.1 hypothetical protein ASG85_14260 [Paenibacillus sp. Soil724D2]
MANFEKALTQELKKVLPAVFPLIAPEGTATPYIVYMSSYGQRDHMLEGYTEQRDIEVTVHVVGGSYSDMKEYTNTMIDSMIILSTMGTDLIPVQSVSYEAPDEMIDPITKENHSFTEFKFRI